MKNFLKSGLLVAVAVMSLAGSSNAAVLSLGGLATSSVSSFNNVAWTLAVTYTPAVSGPVASITAATLTIGAQSFSLRTTGTNVDEIFVKAVAGANNDTMFIRSDFTVPAGAYTGFAGGIAGFATFGAPTQTETGLTVTGSELTSAIATEANISGLGSTVGNTISGTVQFIDTNFSSSTVTLNGTVPAPEPGSVAVLCGLGLIVGRRVLKSRSSKKQEVAA